MIMRQLVQHGNGDRGWLTNTRTFLVAPAIRFAVFPLGQDYHLPHHVFATIPHYRLKKLHEHLMQYRNIGNMPLRSKVTSFRRARRKQTRPCSTCLDLTSLPGTRRKSTSTTA